MGVKGGLIFRYMLKNDLLRRDKIKPTLKSFAHSGWNIYICSKHMFKSLRLVIYTCDLLLLVVLQLALERPKYTKVILYGHVLFKDSPLKRKKKKEKKGKKKSGLFYLNLNTSIKGL